MALKGATILSFLYRIIPARLRGTLHFGFALLDSRIGSPESALRRLFRYQDDLDRLINERAMALGQGEHPKHELTRYHDFFVERTPAGSRVLDVGCGYGAVARSIAQRVSDVEVIGIDMDGRQIAQAKAADNPPNVTFLVGDVLEDLPPDTCDTVVMSNILEHLEDRVGFLRRIQDIVGPRQILIRVPLFERAWQIPMRKKLGIDYFSDPTHCIEHSIEEFEAEMKAAGLRIREKQTIWGEIWAECRPEQERDA